MEGFFAAVEFLSAHPTAAALIEVATLALILVGIGVFVRVSLALSRAVKGVAEEGRDGRKELYKRIDERTAETHERIDGMQKELHDHMLEDATRWGKIAGKLGIDD